MVIVKSYSYGPKSCFLVVLRSYRTQGDTLSFYLVEIRILRQNLGLETIWPDCYVNFDFCRFWLPPGTLSWGQGRQKNENRRLMMPCTTVITGH